MERGRHENWVLREEIFSALHRWPVILSFVLAGGLLGAIFAYIWPASYQATASISVELNPYRALDDRSVAAFAQADFRNIDDYKHWQMTQLNVLVLSDDYLGETLTRLQAKDASWSSRSVSELRDSLQVSWRNAGEWWISAEADESQEAREIVEAWQAVVLDKTGATLDYSRQLFSLELKQRSMEESISEAETRRSELRATGDALEQLSTSFSPESTDGAPPALVRWRLWSLAAQAAGSEPAWRILLDGFPNSEESGEVYIDWIERSLLLIDAELVSLDIRIQDLELSLESEKANWEEALIASKGLSATLALELPDQAGIEVRQARPTSLAALVGSVIGLLSWILFTLAQITIVTR